MDRGTAEEVRFETGELVVVFVVVAVVDDGGNVDDDGADEGFVGAFVVVFGGVVVVVDVIVAFVVVVDAVVELDGGCVDGEAVEGGTLGSSTHPSGVVKGCHSGTKKKNRR